MVFTHAHCSTWGQRRKKKKKKTAFSRLLKRLFCIIQESCARVLLFRGANKEIKNYNSQTAFQVCLTLKNITYTFAKSGVNVTFDATCILGCPPPILLQVAIIAGNFDLAEIIKVHKSSDVGKLSIPAERWLKE